MKNILETTQIRSIKNIITETWENTKMKCSKVIILQTNSDVRKKKKNANH